MGREKGEREKETKRERDRSYGFFIIVHMGYQVAPVFFLNIYFVSVCMCSVYVHEPMKARRYTVCPRTRVRDVRESLHR